MRRSGDLGQATAKLRESLAIHIRALPPESWKIASTKLLLARCLAETKEYAESEKLLLEGYSQIEKQFGPKHPQTLQATKQGAAIYRVLGKPDKAAEWAAKARDLDDGGKQGK